MDDFVLSKAVALRGLGYTHSEIAENIPKNPKVFKQEIPYIYVRSLTMTHMTISQMNNLAKKDPKELTPEERNALVDKLIEVVKTKTSRELYKQYIKSKSA